MRSAINALVLVAVIVTVLGVVAMSVRQVQQEDSLKACEWQLRLLAGSLQNYHDNHRSFPPGTIPNPELPPEKRLSWLVAMWPFYGCSGPEVLLIDTTQPWDSDENREPRMKLFQAGGEADGTWSNPIRLGLMDIYQCSAARVPLASKEPSLTHYVGISGIGVDAATLPLTSRRIGVFGYDRSTRIEDITDGVSNTMMVAETAWKNGPWTAGGCATVRGLVQGELPYFGAEGQFGAHAGRFLVGMADGSVRALGRTPRVGVFEAMATIADADDGP
jgi:hypothetical protein